jgi:hypothetical protein
MDKLAAIPIALLIGIVIRLLYRKRLKHWKAATIQSIHLQLVQTSHRIMYSDEQRYEVVGRYSYSIDGKSFESSRIFPVKTWWTEKQEAERFLSRPPANALVHPKKHHLAYLATGNGNLLREDIYLGMLAVAATAVLFFSH